MRKVLASLSVLALVVGVLAAPAAAQSIRVKASVPFDFTVATRALPAGDYTVETVNSTGTLVVRSEAGSGAVSAMAMSGASANMGAMGQVALVFHRYGDQYFLSQVWDGTHAAGRTIPVSHSEREVSKRASTRQPENVVILARL